MLTMKGFWIFIIAVAVVGAGFVIWYISASNKLRAAKVKIDESRSGIDVALTKRFDLLTKMLEITKGYAAYEKFTMIEAIKMRSGMPLSECAEINGKLNEIAKAINVAVEAYPELKADRSFAALQATCADAEEHLSASRRAYNSNVSYYNQLLVKFPTSAVANGLGLRAEEFFTADEEKREDVKMAF